MSTDDHVPNAQNIDRELQDRQTIEVVMHNQVADVAMNENFAWRKIDNFICRNATV
jgi:hypothetical protein